MHLSHQDVKTCIPVCKKKNRCQVSAVSDSLLHVSVCCKIFTSQMLLPGPKEILRLGVMLGLWGRWP